MTDQQAEEMLRQLSEHYHEPVMPLKRFCATMKKWVDCIEQGCNERPEGGRGQPDHQHGQEYVKQLGHILTDIAKSDLLARLFYLGEEPRTVKCPIHNGHWSGIEWHDESTGKGNVCPHGCGLSGWLPNPSPVASIPEEIVKLIRWRDDCSDHYGEDLVFHTQHVLSTTDPHSAPWVPDEHKKAMLLFRQLDEDTQFKYVRTVLGP